MRDLAEALIHDYAINRKKTRKDLGIRWERHLQPFFAELPAAVVSTEQVTLPRLTPWTQVPADLLGEEVLRRNGHFQVMLGFMRLSLMAAIVTDSSGRLIFINSLAEHYWKVRLWDVRGKHLSDILRLDPAETQRSLRERERILRGSAPEVFMEHFHNGAQRISMLCFPFPDDRNEPPAVQGCSSMTCGGPLLGTSGAQE